MVFQWLASSFASSKIACFAQGIRPFTTGGHRYLPLIFEAAWCRMPGRNLRSRGFWFEEVLT
jgi:hypothetical protein